MLCPLKAFLWRSVTNLAFGACAACSCAACSNVTRVFDCSIAMQLVGLTEQGALSKLMMGLFISPCSCRFRAVEVAIAEVITRVWQR